MYMKVSIHILLFLIIGIQANIASALDSKLTTEFVYDNNLYKKKEKVSDSAMNVKVDFSTLLTPKSHNIKLAYNFFMIRHVQRFSEDYYLNRASAYHKSNEELDFIVKSFVDISGSVNPRGEIGTNENEGKADTWMGRTGGIGFEYRYVKNMSFSMDFQQFSKAHQLESSKAKDFTSRSYQVKNDYKFSGKTKFNVQVKREIFDSAAKDQSNTYKTNYLAGAEWLNSGKVASYLNVGWSTSESASNTGGNFDGIMLESEIHWIRRSYSRLKTSFGRKSVETFEAGNSYYINNWLNFTWNHTFTSKLSGSLLFTNSFNEPATGSVESVYGIQPTLEFAPKKWVVISSMVSYSEKKTETGELNYDNVKVGLSFELKM